MTKVRSFAYPDIGEIVDMMAAFHREENKCRLLHRDPGVTRRVTSEIVIGTNNSGIEIVVAEEDKQLVGYCYLNKTNPDYSDSLVIEEVYVKPIYRGRRIAGRMTTTALVYATANRITDVYTEVKETNVSNLRSNERLGFRVERRERRDDIYYLILRRKVPLQKIRKVGSKRVSDQ